jgi:hypothetical protein
MDSVVRSATINRAVENFSTAPSIGKSVRGFRQLSLGLFGVSGRCVQRFVAQQGCKPDQIAWIVFEVLMCHRVPRQMRVDLEPYTPRTPDTDRRRAVKEDRRKQKIV